MASTGSERTRKILIDECSLATVPIEMFFDQTPLSTGTAFIWTEGSQIGTTSFTGKHVSPTAAEPNRIVGSLLLNGFGWLRKLPAAEFEMLEDRLRNCHTVLLPQPLPEARDGHLLECEGNVEREMLVAGPNDQVSLP